MNFRFLLILSIFASTLYSCEDEFTQETNGTAEVFFTISEIREVENASQALALNIGLDNPLHGGGTVDVSITGADYGNDFTTNAGSANFTVEIEPGTLVSTFTISPVDDENIGANKNLTIQLSNATGSLSLGESTQINFTILDDDDPLVAFVDFETETASIAENSTSNLVLNFTFDQASTNGGSITVSGSGDAVYGTDYIIAGENASNFTIDVPAGATSASFELVPIDNTTFDADKMVTFEVTEVSGGLSIGTVNSIEVTIVNDDAAPNPVIDFSNANPTSFTEADGTVTLNFVLSEATSTESTVTITAGGSAAIGTDYTLNGSSTSPYELVIPAGATSASIDLELVDDTATEDDEKITLTITNITGGLGAGVDLQQQTYTLTDNDAATPYSFAEDFESGSPLADLGFQTVLIDQDFSASKVFDTHNRAGEYPALADVSGTSDYGIQIFYRNDQEGNGLLDNATITPVQEAQGAISISYDVAFVTGSNKNISEVTLYWSDSYTGNGTWNENEWNALETVTAASLEGEGVGRTQFSRRAFDINPSANFYVAVRIKQEVTDANDVVQWRCDNFQVNSK
ncbi:MAG: hypothetical protein COA80_11915 [Leeuwenhoekiella sp.]|nr:MAG: hypothetical protein COA80_11915 [Leeuwenhoekiella sp.]